MSRISITIFSQSNATNNNILLFYFLFTNYYYRISLSFTPDTTIYYHSSFPSQEKKIVWLKELIVECGNKQINEICCYFYHLKMKKLGLFLWVRRPHNNNITRQWVHLQWQVGDRTRTKKEFIIDTNMNLIFKDCY